MADQADYFAMQRAYYDSPDARADPNAVVGNYPFHENFPYETNFLYEYGDIRKPLFPDPENRLAFDIGCGEGRMIRRMSRLFKRCDGADFSENMTAAARERCPQSTIWLTRGNDCGDAPSDTYDLVFCTISLQHIASYDIRSAIIKDITRILKPGGKMTIQMLYSEPFPYVRTRMRGLANNGLWPAILTELYVTNPKDVGWFDNNFAADGTNSKCDTVFGEEQIPDVVKDTERFFSYVSIWFHDISIGRPTYTKGVGKLPEPHPNSHLHAAYPGTHYAFIHGANPRKD